VNKAQRLGGFLVESDSKEQEESDFSSEIQMNHFLHRTPKLRALTTNLKPLLKQIILAVNLNFHWLLQN